MLYKHLCANGEIYVASGYSVSLEFLDWSMFYAFLAKFILSEIFCLYTFLVQLQIISQHTRARMLEQTVFVYVMLVIS